MSIVIQSSSESMIPVVPEPGELEASITPPPATVAGDMLCIAVMSSYPGRSSAYRVVDGETVDVVPGGTTSEHFATEDGYVGLHYGYVATKAAADELKGTGDVRVKMSPTDDSPEPVGNERFGAVIFRVTGADSRRFVEDAKSVTGDLSAEGELTMPSFDPEYRRDNTLLFLSAATYPLGASAPQITAARSTPVGYINAEPAESVGEDDGALGVAASMSVRTLTSADPTGVTPIAYSSQPAAGIGVAFMLRSQNRPPVINLAPEWAAEVGREAVVSATVTDPDFTPVSYVWSQIDGPEDVAIGNVYARAFNFTPNLPGIYRFTLRATDVDGGRTEVQTSVIVPTGTTGPVDVPTSAGWVDQDGGKVDAVELADGQDSTFARTLDLPIGDPLTVRLNPIYGGAAVTLTVRGAASNPSPSIRRTLSLKQSDGTLIAERSYVLPTVMASYVFTTTLAETALINNRSAMTLTIVDEVA